MKNNETKKPIAKNYLHQDPSSQTVRIGKIFSDRKEFDEAVQKLLKDHQATTSKGIFY